MREHVQLPEVVHARRWFILLVLCLSLMVIGIDNTILNVALPTLAKPVPLGGLGASASELQWIVDAYTIVFAGLLLTAGSLGDRFGRYRGLTFGLIVFGTGSLASAMAGSASVLIVTRSLMGVGGAFIMPSTLSMLTNVFTDPTERAKAIGIWAGVSGLGIGLGPIAGGLLLAHFSWGSVFLVNVPIVITALIAGFFLIPESRDPSAPRLDPVGAGLSIVGLGATLWAIIEGPGHGWSSPVVLGMFVLGFTVLGLFLAWELHTDHPMLNMRFFENPRFSAASGAIAITFLTLFGSIFLLTQYLQTVLGYSTVKAGATLIPQAFALMILAPLSTRWVHRWGNKVVVTTGMVIVALSMLAMATFQVDSSLAHVVIVTIFLAVGMANIVAPATDSIMGSLPREKAGVGSAMNDTTRQVGGAVGVAVLGSVLSSRYSSELAGALEGKVPTAILGSARDSIGAALGMVRDVPAARPYAALLTSTGKEAFVSGFHTAVIVAAGILIIAAVGVYRWLPARALDLDVIVQGTDMPGDGSAPQPEPAEPAPVEPDPVDLVHLAPPVELADGIDIGRT
jgi:EmrB/QacA subfamily drug resistance transporter